MIIKKEKGIPIPPEPPINLPQRMDLPVLGTQTSNVASLDEKRNSKESEMKDKARRMRLERESKGEGSMHSNMQPWSKPELDELVGKRIDVLCTVELDNNEKVFKWCQGEVVKVVGENKVEVEWDPAPDIEGCEESMVGEQVLLPTKWNKDNKDGAWRMDVDIGVEDDVVDDESDDELDEDVDDFESDSDSEDE